MRSLAGALALLLAACWPVPGQSSSSKKPAAPKTAARPADPVSDASRAAKADPKTGPPALSSSAPALPSLKFEASAPKEKFSFDVEWRLIHAGTAVFEIEKSQARLQLQSAGLVSALFKVDDTYTVHYDDPFCATSSSLESLEGKRHHQTNVTFDRIQNKASFIERDLSSGAVVRSAQVEIPGCVHDVMGGLLSLRGMTLEPGQSAQVPMSDGRHSASVKVEAQQRETVKTPSGSFETIRYEPYLLNGVVYPRKGRALLWLTDDARKLPVQIQLRMPFPVGTVTLQLQKDPKQ